MTTIVMDKQLLFASARSQYKGCLQLGRVELYQGLTEQATSSYPALGAAKWSVLIFTSTLTVQCFTYPSYRNG